MPADSTSSPGAVCGVCGSTAVAIRSGRVEGVRHRVVALCRGHLGVCWPHLADPCPACAAEECGHERTEQVSEHEVRCLDCGLVSA